MTTRFLALYIGAVLVLAFLAYSVISLVPGPGVERARLITQAILVACAVSFGVFGMIAGRLPSQHWLNRSVMLRGALMMIAAAGTLFVLVIVG
jgi:hypothetical protein